MREALSLIWTALVGVVRSPASLAAEIMVLRHQINILRRHSPKRQTFSAMDRLIFAGLYRLAPTVLNALAVLKPDTVIKWHRAGFRSYWRWRSRRGGRPTLPTEIRKLIREMSIANPLWGAPRIHGGLDVSVKETSVCIVNDTGRIVREVKVASEPEALLAVLKNPAYHFERIGLEAGPLSQWLFSALAEVELPVVRVETQHMQAVLKAQINKTDRNDARSIARMMRAGLYRPVHVKTLRSQKLRMLLTHRKLLQSKAIAIDNDLRGTLRNFGLKVGVVGTVKFEARIQELVENFPDLAALVEPLLIVRRALREQIVILHRRLLAIVRDDEVCRRLMTTPGVGPVVALTYRATV